MAVAIAAVPKISAQKDSLTGDAGAEESQEDEGESGDDEQSVDLFNEEPEEEEMAVLQKVKQTSHDLKRVLTEDEFVEIVKTVKS